jgi:quinol-cytochrome oxidoreductase complex cytochrome b subunit
MSFNLSEEDQEWVKGEARLAVLNGKIEEIEKELPRAKRRMVFSLIMSVLFFALFIIAIVGVKL